MKGLVLASHGQLALGMADTLKLFFKEIPQFQALALAAEEDPEDFYTRLKQAIDETDSGEGVLVAVDLLGGTPSNCCSRILAQREIEVIAGMNLPMLMQYLADREGIGEMDPHTVVESGQKGVVHQNELLACTWDDDE